MLGSVSGMRLWLGSPWVGTRSFGNNRDGKSSTLSPLEEREAAARIHGSALLLFVVVVVHHLLLFDFRGAE